MVKYLFDSERICDPTKLYLKRLQLRREHDRDQTAEEYRCSEPTASERSLLSPG